MQNFNVSCVEEGLTAYAAERQNGFERHQRQNAPPWAESRRFWIDAVLQGMARQGGQEPDPNQMERFDRHLEQAAGSASARPAAHQLRRDTIHMIGNYLSTLETADGDHRRQITAVRDLLEDISTHLPWAAGSNELHDILDQAERILSCATRLLHHLSRIFEEQTPRGPARVAILADRKLRRRIREKKMAMGHKPDDHENEEISMK